MQEGLTVLVGWTAGVQGVQVLQLNDQLGCREGSGVNWGARGVSCISGADSWGAGGVRCINGVAIWGVCKFAGVGQLVHSGGCRVCGTSANGGVGTNGNKGNGNGGGCAMLLLVTLLTLHLLSTSKTS